MITPEEIQRNDAYSRHLIAHELVHVLQYERFGGIETVPKGLRTRDCFAPVLSEWSTRAGGKASRRCCLRRFVLSAGLIKSLPGINPSWPGGCQLESVFKIVRGVFGESTREPGHQRDTGQRLSDRIDFYPPSNAPELPAVPAAGSAC
jgi:hypothetical protein